MNLDKENIEPIVKLDKDSTLETTKQLLIKNTLGVVMMAAPFFVGGENVEIKQKEYVSVVENKDKDTENTLKTSEQDIIITQKSDIQQIERQANTFGDYLLNITSTINKLHDVDVNKSFNGDNIFNTITHDLIGLPNIPSMGGTGGVSSGGNYDPMTPSNELYTSIKGVDKLIKDNNNDLSGKTVVLEIGTETIE